MRIATAVVLLFPNLTMKHLSICLIFPITSHPAKAFNNKYPTHWLLQMEIDFKIWVCN